MGSKENQLKVRAKVVANGDGTFTGRLAFAGPPAKQDDLIEAAKRVKGVSGDPEFTDNEHTLEILIGEFYNTSPKAEGVLQAVAKALNAKILGAVVHER